MTPFFCKACGKLINAKANFCPSCGCSLTSSVGDGAKALLSRKGFEWRSKTDILGIPLIHVAFGRNKSTGRLFVARGIIAIGQFGIGVVTIAQVGIGLLFGFGQFMLASIAVAQIAGGIYFGLGQFSSGKTAIGQIACGTYVLAQKGFGKHVWSQDSRDPSAREYFDRLWESVSKAVK